MNRAIMWLAGNPVAANLLMVLIVVSGLMAAATISVEVFPEVELDRISIRVPYLGAAPEEVESGVVIRVEESIQNVDGIKEIVSTAAEGSASIIVELELGADPQQVFHEVTNNIQEITTFPIETERPVRPRAGHAQQGHGYRHRRRHGRCRAEDDCRTGCGTAWWQCRTSARSRS